MAEISWIKLSTGLPDNKKIKRIRKLPDGDKVILFWVFLLARAGESNKSGGLFFTDSMAYSEEDLAADFDFTVELVKFAVMTLEKYSMITRYDDIIFIKNWEEYQSVDSMEKIREKNRIRKQRQREKERLLINHDMSRDSHKNVTASHATDIDIDKELDKDIKDKDITETDPPASSNKSKKVKPKKHKYGEFKNVLLTDEEIEKLKSEYQDWQQKIDNLSLYIGSTGKSYKSHYLTILKWARKDADQPKKIYGGNQYKRRVEPKELSKPPVRELPSDEEISRMIREREANEQL